MAVVKHSFFIIRKKEAFCGLIHFLLVNMNCFCISTVIPFLKLRKDKGSTILLLSICKPGVFFFFFLLSGYGNRFFFFFFNDCCENPYMKRGVKSLVCAFCFLRFICGKDIFYSRLYFQRRDCHLCGAK